MASQDGQNETEQPDHSASLGDSITASTQIRFSVHTRGVFPRGQHRSSRKGSDAGNNTKKRSRQLHSRQPQTFAHDGSAQLPWKALTIDRHGISQTF
jgi:hypothetical protein